MARLTLHLPKAWAMLGVTLLLCLGLTMAESRAEEPEPAARYGPVKVTDTLWTIARRHRPDTELSVQQTMLAIVAMNPDAFRDGNIHHMYTGYHLDIPSAEVIARFADDDARELMEQQRHDGPGLASAELAALQETAQLEPAERSGSDQPERATTADEKEAAVAAAEEEAEAQVAELREELSEATRGTEALERENQALQDQLADLNQLVDELRDEAAAVERLTTEVEQLQDARQEQGQERAIGELVLKWLSWPWVLLPVGILLVILLGLWAVLRRLSRVESATESPYEVAKSKQESAPDSTDTVATPPAGDTPTGADVDADTASSKQDSAPELDSAAADSAVGDAAADPASETTAEASPAAAPEPPKDDSERELDASDAAPDGSETDREFRDIDDILAEAETEVAEQDDPDDLNAEGGQTPAERLAAELDLARAYLEMDELDDAREVLSQVRDEANELNETALADEAAALLRRLDH